MPINPTPHPSTRDLDAEVAVALGWQWMSIEHHYDSEPHYRNFRSLRPPGEGPYSHFPLATGAEPLQKYPAYTPPAFSTSIAAAFELVERMRADGASFVVETHPTGDFWVAFNRELPYTSRVKAHAPTLPIAICLAFLAAKEPTNA